MNTHTRGEWAIGYGDSSRAFGIFTKEMLDKGLNESPICLISPADKVTETDKANAELIVKAVNERKALLDALGDAITLLETFTEQRRGDSEDKTEVKRLQSILNNAKNI